MHDERSPYYYLPGGRVKLHETAETAVLREVKEELGAEGKIIRPLWLNQGFFTEEVGGEKFHEVCIYFLVDILNTDILSRGNEFTSKEKNRTYKFEWLSFESLKNEYFYPLFLKDKILSLPDEFTLLTELE